ncbi:hypothetical protein CIB48_g12207, partial [Xylaria polymorpha]
GIARKVCYRREVFRSHLEKDHQLADQNILEAKLEKCRVGRNCEARFWCGFCQEIVEIKQKGVQAWAERFDHIDEHFTGRNRAQKVITEWKNFDPSRRSKDAAKEDSDDESQSCSSARNIKTQHFPRPGTHPSPSNPRPKRKRNDGNNTGNSKKAKGFESRGLICDRRSAATSPASTYHARIDGVQNLNNDPTILMVNGLVVLWYRPKARPKVKLKNIPSIPQVQMPSMPRMGGGGMKGTWQHVSLPPLPRSSHSLDIIAGNAYIFGGEVEPRKPVDNDMHVVVLPWSGAPADYYAIKAKPSPKASAAEDDAAIPTIITEEDETEAQLRDPLTDVPLSSSPPLATASDVGSEAESSTPDKGKAPQSPRGASPAHRARHRGDRDTHLPIRRALGSPIPAARSYHAAVATEKPRDFSIKPMRLRRSSTWKEWAEGDSAEVGIPQRPVVGTTAERATDDEAAGAGFGTFIIHGGCLADGTRTSDVWAYDVHARTWKQLPDAPGPARGGAALALAKGRLYRFGGFDGEAELGGQLDVLQLVLDEFDDQTIRGEIGIFARGTWESIVAPSSSSGNVASSETEGLTASSSPHAGTASEPWPLPRSVANLSLVQAGGGREYLLLSLGESAPSADGHASAGRFHADVWAFQVPPLGGTTASFTDAFLHTVGRKTGESRWSPVAVGPFDADEELDVQGPGPRGWFAAAPLGDLEENAIFVAGGLSESGARLGDGWIFRLG